MVANNSDFYQIGASLSSDAPSYVQRQADDKFYKKLREGKFCYVLNSRQMGKSSLRVRTMQRLEAKGTVCAAIDLTGIGKHKVTISQWYGGIVYALVESCQLEEKFDFDWQIWWQEHQKILDPVRCLSLFIEQVLLKNIQQPIVIFVDEIDRVLSQDFSLDDFFALIRFFQNQRVDKPIFERLTFALLGVATPSDLITDKTQTPFNIGEEIELHGFQLEEIQPLIKGLQGRFDNPRRVIEEILDWTGGQPFLTQKLCKLMVDESFKDNPCTVSELVRAKIIDNWESQDNPEHLRTIRNRICSDDQRASYLLELYQQVRQSGELASNNSIEVSELQLSGLVVKRQDKLKVYNHIYREIFDSNWIKKQLNNLRPYSENFRFWVASRGADESRLLRGKALQEADEWARDKNLSYQDKQYLAASKEKEIQEEIAAQEQEAALSRERMDKEAAEARNQLLSEANKKAQRRISIGIVVLVLAILGAATIGLSSRNQMKKTKEEVETVKQLNKLAGELENNSKYNSEEVTFDYNEALRLSALSFNINNHSLKQALVFVAESQVYQQLKKMKEAEQEIKESQKNLEAAYQEAFDSSQGLQIQVLFHKTHGSLLAHNKKNPQAIESYKTAFKILKNYPNETNFTKNNQLITAKNIESVHRDLIKLISQNHIESELKKEVEASFTKHLYTQLEDFLKVKNWESADRQTDQLMLNLAQREKEQYLDINSIKNFSCPDLKRIDQLWVNADNRFGFSVQKKIWISTGNRLVIKPQDWTEKDVENYLRFAKTVGWYEGDFVGYNKLMERIKQNSTKYRGSLPFIKFSNRLFFSDARNLLLSRCNLIKFNI
ncbi:AAA-like domain-containing protein [Nostoc sp.]|uniref:AAA-like domain-containing protein n=1 Tax=Nostoc sp. TaxID=1180 RepID=UPI002FFCA656